MILLSGLSSIQLIFPTTLSVIDAVLIVLGVLAVFLLSVLIVSVKRLTGVMMQQQNLAQQVFSSLQDPQMSFNPQANADMNWNASESSETDFIQPAFLFATSEGQYESLNHDLEQFEWDGAEEEDEFSRSIQTEAMPQELQDRLKTFQNIISNLQEHILLEKQVPMASDVN